MFPVVVYGTESWTIRKAEHQRTDAFDLWCWRRLLRVPWTARRSNQSILKETEYPNFSVLNIHWKDWCWSCSFNTLATRCEKLTHWKRPCWWERLKAGGEEASEDEMVGWHHWLNRYEFEQAPGDTERQGGLGCCSPRGCKESATIEWLNHKWEVAVQHRELSLVLWDNLEEGGGSRERWHMYT